MWHITNNKLYSGTSTSDTSNPVFIVAVRWNFEKSIVGSNVSYTNKDAWTNATFVSNRLAAANTVIGVGNYFTEPYNTNCGYTGTIEGSNVDTVVNDHGNNIFYIPDVDNFAYTGGAYPRGSQTWCLSNSNGKTIYAGSGHWRYVPKVAGSPYMGCSYDYESALTNGWPTSNNNNYHTNHNIIDDFGNEQGAQGWHHNWLSTVKGKTATYGRIPMWHLMDEPYRSNAHWDSWSNYYSVIGHYDFVRAVEGASDTRPKMVGIKHQNAIAWSSLSNVTDIICGNDYGRGTTNPVYNVNMVKWSWSKVSGYTTKMVIPWLAGFANSNTTSGEVCLNYMFYGAICEGARGVLWYMANTDGYNDLSNYRYLKGIYSNFSNNRIFRPGYSTKPSHMEFILKGSSTAGSIIYPTATNGYNYPTTVDDYGVNLTARVSSLFMTYSNRFRLFIVNHMAADQDFQFSTTNSIIIGNNWVNAYDQNQTNHVMGLTNSAMVLSDALSSYGYRIYDIGPAL